MNGKLVKAGTWACALAALASLAACNGRHAETAGDRSVRNETAAERGRGPMSSDEARVRAQVQRSGAASPGREGT